MRVSLTTLDTDFEEFWRAYPHRVGKLKARAAFEKLRRSGITQAELVDGIQQYIATKPGWQAWAHPTTWLNQGRWMDEPAPETIERFGKQTSRLLQAVANIKREGA